MSRLSLVLLLAICGCSALSANGPKTGVPANGQPLLIADDVKEWTTVQHDHVGEVRVENEAGERLARADVYEDRRHYNVKEVWFPVQGDQVISDEDFFRIAGDQRAVDATLRFRARNRRWNRTGKISMLVGVGLLLVARVPDSRTAQLFVLLGSFGAIGGGFYLTVWSHEQQAPENHAVDRSTAVEAAQQYDRTHGVALSRSF